MEHEALRSMRYSPGSPGEALAWQEELRARLFDILKMDDLVSRKVPADLRVETVSSEQREKYELRDLEIDSTAGRRMKVVVTLPAKTQARCPAVVAVAGHGGTRFSCYGPGSDHRYAHILAEKGYVTVSTDVGQHEVREESRTLIGERLWDLMRCIDLLLSLDAVDPERIGCAGLSLGGEMTMWLGAMDERVRAVVSSGFLTRMEQLEGGHCKCWKFPGLRELVDFADIYSLIAPRHLLCQNGWQEQPTWFPVPLAREAMKEIEPIYADMGRPGDVSLVAHDGGHEIALPSLLEFLDCRLARTNCTLIEGTR